MKNKDVNLRKIEAYISKPSCSYGRILPWHEFTEVFLSYTSIHEKQKIFERFIPGITEQFMGSVTMNVEDFVSLKDDYCKIEYVIYTTISGGQLYDESTFILKVNQ